MFRSEGSERYQTAGSGSQSQSCFMLPVYPQRVCDRAAWRCAGVLGTRAAGEPNLVLSFMFPFMLAELWPCMQACWGRVQPGWAPAAHASAEELLASTAEADKRELARRERAYVANRRAEGVSEAFARVHNRLTFCLCECVSARQESVTCQESPLCGGSWHKGSGFWKVRAAATR